MIVFACMHASSSQGLGFRTINRNPNACPETHVSRVHAPQSDRASAGDKMPKLTQEFGVSAIHIVCDAASTKRVVVCWVDARKWDYL